ncbi:hypothetical protein F5Y15DRAFT_376481 [Xylariaceae sp. FL0016]|nr:hypothetical protein F5Y15DRAFT_376481 [Xylariaceae sp. FL0016]
MSQPSRNTKSTSDTEVPPEAPPEAPSASSTQSTQAELAQAFKDLARGEQQAAVIEANLTALEDKLDALLAAVEGGANEVGAHPDTGARSTPADSGPGTQKEKE